MKEDVEKRAMEVAKRFEIKEHREPVDFRGFDILSISAEGQEFHIEVKGRTFAKGQFVIFTDSEIKRARTDPNFRAYIVLFEDKNARLYTIPRNIVIERAKPESEGRWRLYIGKWIGDFRQEL